MYEKEKTVMLASSASLFPNNVCRLTLNGKMYAGVVHQGEFNIVSPSAPVGEPRVVAARVGSSTSVNATIMQASWVEACGRMLLVLATIEGVLIYEWDGSVLIHVHLLPTPQDDASASFTRGIAALSTGTICVGMHTGEILVFRVGDEVGVIGDVGRVRWHARPITTLAAQKLTLVAADDVGDITIARDRPDIGLEKVTGIDTYGSPVTCLDTWRDYVLAAYLSGHLRIFNVDNGFIIAEVCAHAQCITGLDVAKESGLVVSAGEDTFVRVWQLSSQSNQPIEHKYSKSEENVVLCGSAFIDSRGSGYVTTGYDRLDLLCYAM